MSNNNNFYTLKGLGISASEFINVFYSPDDTKICLRVLADKKGSAFSGTNITTTLKELPNILALLEQHNSDDRGIFLIINAGGHTDKEIIRINAQYVEMDNVSLEEQLKKIQDFPLEPSLIVKTRKSLHCYWLMKKADVGEFRHIQKQLVKHFDGDSACVNESRVMRIPGFYHCKEERILVDCIKYNPEIRYTQEQLSEHLPDIPVEISVGGDSPPTTPISSAGTQKGMIRVRCECCFLQHCKRNAKTLPEPLWYAKITNLAVFEGGDEAIHLFSKPHPNYSFEQTQNKINRFRKSGTKPITCAKIASHGFACPNMGKCKVKSPAGLAFIPLDMKMVRKFLSDSKTANTAYDNIEIARKFINDYLYNNELAESFISSEMKAKFAFKASDIKQLVTFHNELYKAFSATAFKRRKKHDNQGDELPQWYEYKKNGTLKFMGSVLADSLATNEQVIFCGDRFHFYEGGVYVPKEDVEAENFVRTFMSADNDKTYSQISDTTKQWKMQIYTNSNKVNANAYLINLKNGIYNIHTRQLSPHNPDILSTIRINARYEIDAKCPHFLKYLHDVLPESEHSLMQEVMGYILVPINKAKKAIVFLGEKDTGKSTMLYICEDVLLGEDNVSNVPLQKLDDRFSTIHLFGKLANVVGDLPSGSLKETGTFKSITGGDKVVGESKHKDGIKFKPFCTLIFACNAIPKSYKDRSTAFFDRLIIMLFENIIQKDLIDRGLDTKLMAEADGIFMWALEGLHRLMDNGWEFTTTDRTERELHQYKTEGSYILQFAEECLIADPNAQTRRIDIWNAFVEYCHENGIKYDKIYKRTVNKELEEHFKLQRSRTTGSRQNTFVGVRLNK